MAADNPCPCCGYLVFEELPGSQAICPICGWEDDLAQLQAPLMNGANIALVEAQANFRKSGFSERRLARRVRKPRPGVDQRDPDWRPFDRARDGAGGGAATGEDYYWRR